MTATVELTVRGSPGSSGRSWSIPIETGAENKEMGRILIRRGGESVAAGATILHFPLPAKMLTATRRGDCDLDMKALIAHLDSIALQHIMI